ncbi:FKBP-type peptidyl-prolyl cis-trans isomerase [Alteriqipengyuania sp.]|uniref:FKBP-type peptidyl-prolyl cis-trans isomerase n=1 Tax=Alteriqipengyuania sp. TaxID=2800692 RepID=UPI00351345C4
MTEITRVPLRPIAKGSLTKLWIGVIAAIGLAILLAWAVMPQAYGLTVIEEGEGPNPTAEDVLFVNYVGKLEDGTVFDQSQPLPLPPEAQGMFPEGNPLPLSNMIPGFTQGALDMQKGGKYELLIRADQAYGDTPPEGSPIPPGADLTFEVEVIEIMSQAEFQRRVQMITQLMQQNGTMPGAPQGAAPPQGAPPPQ